MLLEKKYTQYMKSHIVYIKGIKTITRGYLF